jgi:NAD(P)-dependent dehydrogenase (short-subunit alcohol dehydrogenase family)
VPGEGLLAGKVIVITGASLGIGADSARLFAREGAQLVLNARSEKPLADLVGELPTEAVPVAGDIGDPEVAQRLVDTATGHFGRIDGAFNNAGIGQDGNLLADVPEDVFDNVLRVNAKNVWLGMRAQIRGMLAAGTSGSIVNTSSVAGYRVPVSH